MARAEHEAYGELQYCSFSLWDGPRPTHGSLVPFAHCASTNITISCVVPWEHRESSALRIRLSTKWESTKDKYKVGESNYFSLSPSMSHLGAIIGSLSFHTTIGNVKDDLATLQPQGGSIRSPPGLLHSPRH